ncbi:uncharacterized protein [Physcomitrium patens]|uniref:uncharacterized protein isoform X1 n=1 Tax=Physcomitrium patens TaxID=3218 RepID=UPI003CCE2B7D
MDAFHVSSQSHFVEDFAADSLNVKHLMHHPMVPQPTVLEHVIKDLFEEAIAVLWIDFVWEVRWCWDEGYRLPRCLWMDPLIWNHVYYIKSCKCLPCVLRRKHHG